MLLYPPSCCHRHCRVPPPSHRSSVAKSSWQLAGSPPPALYSCSLFSPWLALKGTSMKAGCSLNENQQLARGLELTLAQPIAPRISRAGYFTTNPLLSLYSPHPRYSLFPPKWSQQCEIASLMEMLIADDRATLLDGNPASNKNTNFPTSAKAQMNNMLFS